MMELAKKKKKRKKEKKVGSEKSGLRACPMKETVLTAQSLGATDRGTLQ